MLDHVAALADNSTRFAAAIESTVDAAGTPSTAATVPACPDWSAADLAWHLTEVQYVWAVMTGDRLSAYTELTPLERPADADLLPLFHHWSGRLGEVLTARDPSETCWSWHPEGGTVAWVRRRQAQEALIHRVDAEQTLAGTGGPGVGPIDEELAADGIDEILRVMLDVDPVPAWGRFEPDGSTVRLVTRSQRWDMELGRLIGTDDDGNDRDLGAVRMEEAGDRTPDATLRGSAGAIDLWLWRRRGLDSGPGGELEVDGDRGVVERLADLAAID
ncbi:MAG: maleylpyruvate isomerase N-terminal domain-containing protein [Actinomycetota bacterium]